MQAVRTNNWDQNPSQSSWSVQSPIDMALIFRQSLLVLTVIGSVATLIPQVKTAASLCLRSISLLNAGATGIYKLREGKTLDQAITISKIAAVALGIAGMAVGAPSYMIASLVSDSAAQVFEMIQAFNQKRSEGFFHLAVVISNLLILGATVAYSTATIALTIIALLIQLCVMVALSAQAAEDYNITDGNRLLKGFCYGALAANMLVQLILFIFAVASRPTAMQFKVRADDKWFTNKDEVKWTSCHNYWDNSPESITSSGVIHKGETINFTVPYTNRATDVMFIHSDTPHAFALYRMNYIYPDYSPRYDIIIGQTIPALSLLGPAIAFEHHTSLIDPHAYRVIVE